MKNDIFIGLVGWLVHSFSRVELIFQVGWLMISYCTGCLIGIFKMADYTPGHSTGIIPLTKTRRWGTFQRAASGRIQGIQWHFGNSSCSG